MTPCDNCKLKLQITHDPFLARVERPYFDGCSVIKEHNEKIEEEEKLYILGETEIYLEDDGDDPPYTQEWLDLETHEFQLPDGVFKPGDKVEILIRKKN